MLFTSIKSIYNTSGYAAFNPEIPLISFDVKDVRLDDKWYVCLHAVKGVLQNETQMQKTAMIIIAKKFFLSV